METMRSDVTLWLWNSQAHFICPHLCPPNGPVDYRLCGLMLERVYIVQTLVRNTSRCDQSMLVETTVFRSWRVFLRHILLEMQTWNLAGVWLRSKCRSDWKVGVVCSNYSGLGMSCHTHRCRRGSYGPLHIASNTYCWLLVKVEK